MDTASRTTATTAQGIALVVAPILGLATTLVWPETPLDLRERLTVLSEAGSRMDLAHALNLLTILAFGGAVLGMVRLLAGRKPRALTAGAVLSALGLIGWTAVLTLSAVEAQAARGPVTDDVVSLLEGLQVSPVIAALTAMFLLGLSSGLIVLAVTLRRARVVPTWVPVAICLAVVIDMVASTFTIAVVVVWVLQCAAWGRTGLTLLRGGRVEGRAGEHTDLRPVAA